MTKEAKEQMVEILELEITNLKYRIASLEAEARSVGRKAGDLEGALKALKRPTKEVR